MDSFLAYPLEPNSFPGDSDMRTLARFRRTMEAEDQRILDEMLTSVQHHWPLQSSAAHWTPLDLLLMTMLIEQKKDLLRLQAHVHDFQDIKR